MSRPWRHLAIALFTVAVLFGALVGDDLLALTSETRDQLRLYTEILELAHESYGTDVEYQGLIEASIVGMLRSLDPHTSFLDARSYQGMRDRQQESFFGLGILVSMRNGRLTVISPIEGTPAWRLGLRAGDVIHAIEGDLTEEMSLDAAVTRLKGPKGTQVHVQIVRRGLEEPLELDITRAEIPQTTVRYAYMLEPGTGYVRLTDFTRSSTDEMRDALDDLEAQGMERLILDLRSNGGGLLDQTVAISDFFVPEGSRIVETRGRLTDSHQVFLAEGERKPFGKPLVVLVDQGTASAAEILAGAIQDHDVGWVVGTPTWGKGLVQTVYNLSYGTAVALTTAKYYTPSGRLIQRDYSSYYDYTWRAFDDEGGEDEGDVEGGFEGSAEPQEVPTPLAPPASEFQTDLGRPVFGGGGITPDSIVEPPDNPPTIPFLFARNAFFDFAVDVQAREHVTDPSWQPAPELLEEFQAWLVSEELLDEDELEEAFEDERTREFALRQIHSDLFTSAFGTEAAHRILAQGDVLIQSALDLFPKAEDLLVARFDPAEVGTPRDTLAERSVLADGIRDGLPSGDGGPGGD